MKSVHNIPLGARMILQKLANDATEKTPDPKSPVTTALGYGAAGAGITALEALRRYLDPKLKFVDKTLTPSAAKILGPEIEAQHAALGKPKVTPTKAVIEGKTFRSKDPVTFTYPPTLAGWIRSKLPKAIGGSENPYYTATANLVPASTGKRGKPAAGTSVVGERLPSKAMGWTALLSSIAALGSLGYREHLLSGMRSENAQLGNISKAAPLAVPSSKSEIDNQLKAFDESEF